MAAEKSTFEDLRYEVEKIGEKYDALVQRSEKMGVLFAQIVTVDELFSIREMLNEVLYKADNMLEDKYEYDEVVGDAQDILDSVDSTFYSKKFISER